MVTQQIFSSINPPDRRLPGIFAFTGVQHARALWNHRFRLDLGRFIGSGSIVGNGWALNRRHGGRPDPSKLSCHSRRGEPNSQWRKPLRGRYPDGLRQGHLPPPAISDEKAFVDANPQHKEFHYTDVAIQQPKYQQGMAGTRDDDVVQIIRETVSTLRGRRPNSGPARLTQRQALWVLAHIQDRSTGPEAEIADLRRFKGTIHHLVGIDYCGSKRGAPKKI